MSNHGIIFTAEEQAAMDRGYTMAKRRAESGRMFGIYPQAISEAHAAKLDIVNGFTKTCACGRTVSKRVIECAACGHTWEIR